MKPVDPLLAEFGANTASFVSRVLGAEWACFYLVDGQGQPFGFQVHGTPLELRMAYVQQNIAQCDPLHPANLVDTDLRFVTVFDRRLSCPVESRRTYWNFLCAFGTRDCAEMIFRVGGRAVAGMSLIWTRRSGISAERERGEAVQSYVEFNLASRLGSVRGSEDSEPDIHPALTDREREIVQLVCRGATNVQIARRLNIGVATVKTHLIHVFEKCKVETRAGLVSQVLSAGARLDN